MKSDQTSMTPAWDKYIHDLLPNSEARKAFQVFFGRFLFGSAQKSQPLEKLYDYFQARKFTNQEACAAIETAIKIIKIIKNDLHAVRTDMSRNLGDNSQVFNPAVHTTGYFTPTRSLWNTNGPAPSSPELAAFIDFFIILYGS